MPCREGWGGTEGAGRGSAQRTLGQWWPVCGAGAENKNWGLPMGALVVVGKDGGGDLNQQQGELGEGTAVTQGGGPVGLLAHGRFWGCRVSLASAAVFIWFSLMLVGNTASCFLAHSHSSPLLCTYPDHTPGHMAFAHTYTYNSSERPNTVGKQIISSDAQEVSEQGSAVGAKRKQLTVRVAAWTSPKVHVNCEGCRGFCWLEK